MKSILLTGYNFPYILWEDGRITGGRLSAPLKHGKGKWGPYVRLATPAGPQFRTIHRLLAEAFIPNPNNEPDVRHIDGNFYNYSLTNLEWSNMSVIVNNSLDTGKLVPWLRGKDLVDKNRICLYCNQPFKYKYQNKDTKCCSKGCAQKFRARNMAL